LTTVYIDICSCFEVKFSQTLILTYLPWLKYFTSHDFWSGSRRSLIISTGLQLLQTLINRYWLWFISIFVVVLRWILVKHWYWPTSHDFFENFLKKILKIFYLPWFWPGSSRPLIISTGLQLLQTLTNRYWVWFTSISVVVFGWNLVEHWYWPTSHDIMGGNFPVLNP